MKLDLYMQELLLPGTQHASAVSMQVDSFNRAQSGKMSRRISRLWSGKKSPKTPSPEGKGLYSQPSGGTNVTLDEMLIYQPVRGPTPVHKDPHVLSL